jgi:hypothetical protein
MPVGNRQIVRKLFNELFNKRKLAVADEIIGPNHINHDIQPVSNPNGPKRVGLKHAAFAPGRACEIRPSVRN